MQGKAGLHHLAGVWSCELRTCRGDRGDQLDKICVTLWN